MVNVFVFYQMDVFVLQKIKNKKMVCKSLQYRKMGQTLWRIRKEKKYYTWYDVCFLFTFCFYENRYGYWNEVKYTNKEIVPDHTLIFKDNSKIDIRKIGQNSAYFFYFIPGEKVLTATPIADNLKQIKRLPK